MWYGFNHKLKLQTTTKNRVKIKNAKSDPPRAARRARGDTAY